MSVKHELNHFSILRGTDGKYLEGPSEFALRTKELSAELRSFAKFSDFFNFFQEIFLTVLST
jgi:hypothetical protein